MAVESDHWNEEESLLAEVFQQCDRDGSGYITRDELAALCRSHEQIEEGRLDALMSSMDADKDGHISFEEFKAGFKAYSAGQLVSGGETVITNSTPKHMISDEEVYESAVGSEFSWGTAAERIDPDGLLQGMGVEKVWEELAGGDPAMLEPFENFLGEVVLQIKNNQQDKNKLQGHIKKIMEQHSREVTEMEQILQEQILQAQEDSKQKSDYKAKRLSSHYSSLLADQEAQIETLRDKETSLQKSLSDRVVSETNLREERRQLINANEELRQKLSSPHPQNLRSPTNLMRDITIHEKVESFLGQHDHQCGESCQEEPDHHSVESSQDEPELNSISPQHETFHDQLSQQLAGCPPAQVGGEVESSRDQLVQQWVESSSDNNHIKYYPPVKSPEHVNECIESSGSVDEREHRHGHQEQGSLDERPRPLGEDVSLTLSLPVDKRLAAESPSSAACVVHRVFKVAFLGDSGVGKSSLILRLCEGRFNVSCVSTLGLDFSTKLLMVEDETVVFQLWDTAGQEKFRNALTPVYLRRADAFVIVYDVTSQKSFKSIKSWLSIVSAALREQPPVVMLVGNKTDQQSKREVTSEDGRQLALELQALFSEMSALSGDNVLQAHTTLAQLLLTRENEHLEKLKSKALEITSASKRKKCSC